MGKNISNKEIQLTIQGQTVSSNFGTIDSAQFNIEQLLNAGISNDLFQRVPLPLKKMRKICCNCWQMKVLRHISALKDHPDFLNYLAHISPVAVLCRNQYRQPARQTCGWCQA